MPTGSLQTRNHDGASPKRAIVIFGNVISGAPETIRTFDLNIRSIALYPTEFIFSEY